ncbi:MAG: metallophosphoesterase [Archangium sp.]
MVLGVVVVGCAHKPLIVVAAGDVSHPDIKEQAVTATLVESLKPSVVLLAGDAQYGEGKIEEFMKAYEPTWGRFKAITRPTPGNHEYKSGAHGYFEYFGANAGPKDRGYYSFDLGDWHFVALNTGQTCEGGACDEGSEQLKWLEDDLSKTTKKCVVAYWHHPRFNSGKHGPFPKVEPFWRVLVAHGAELIINGHEHFYERFAPVNGIVQLTVGTGGIGFSDFSDTVAEGSQARQNDTFGVMKLELTATTWKATFVGVPGSKFTDQVSGECH